jgi:hypothetical protein
MQFSAKIGPPRGCNSVVECLLPKQKVVGSSPITRSKLFRQSGRHKQVIDERSGRSTNQGI